MGSLIWSDEFTEPTLDRTIWTPWNVRETGACQFFADSPQNFSMDDGAYLQLFTQNTATPDGHSPADPLAYTSPQLSTRGLKPVPVGSHVEAAIEAPNTPGLLTAFWMMGTTASQYTGWPGCGEIDIVEFPSQLGVTKVSCNLHGPKAGDPGNDQSMNAATPTVPDYTWHRNVYAIDWTASEIIWYVNGAVVGSITQAQYEAAGGDWTPFLGAEPFYVLLSHAVGNPWTGPPTSASKFPAKMLVDYVRVTSLP